MHWLIGQWFPPTAFGWASMLVQAIVWPATVVVIAAMFRSEVGRLLDRLVRVKFQNVEARFARDLRETEDLAARSDVPQIILDRKGETRRVNYELDDPARPPLVAPTRTPRDAIEAGWASLAFAAEKRALDGPKRLLFERLRSLRLQVAREKGWEPSADEADRFVRLALALAAGIAREGGPASGTGTDSR